MENGYAIWVGGIYLEDLPKLGMERFENIYKLENKDFIAEVVRMISLFHLFISY